jgi:hypothetical protein
MVVGVLEAIHTVLYMACFPELADVILFYLRVVR